MEAVKKYWFWGILISILTVFAMSYNANAVSFDLSNYSLKQNIPRVQNYCRLQNGEISDQTLANCTFDSVANIQLLKEISSKTTYTLKKGDIIQFYFIVATINNYNASGGSYFINEVTNSNGLITLDYEAIDDYSNLDFVTFDNQLTYENAYVLYDFFANYKVAKVYRITQLVPSDGTYTLGLNIDSTNVNRYIYSFIQSVQDVFYFSIKNFNIYERSESQENKEVEEKTQEAADASETAGGSSSSDAQTGTTSLINAITGAVTVISSASPTNCRINGNMGNLDMGQLDLCANPAPAFVQTIGSLILILMCVPLAITLFNRFISLFRSFQS